MTRATLTRSVGILRGRSLYAESMAWAALLAGLTDYAAWWDREADRLWERSEELARAEVTEVTSC